MISRAIRLASIALVLSSAVTSAQSFNRNAWIDDYAFLKHTLEKRYSNLAWFASPEGGLDLPALDRRTSAALKMSVSDEDAQSAILNFVRAFHDGHFSQLASLELARTPASVNPAAAQ